MRNILLYLKLIQVQFRSQMKFRANFFMEMITTLVLSIVTFGTLYLVMQRFKTIAGWNIWELGFLYGLVETSFGVMDMVFSGFDPQNFGKRIRLGMLDQLLLRPASLTIQILGSEFLLRRIGRISQGAAIFFLCLTNLSVAWTLEKIVLIPFVCISTIFFFGGLFIIGSGITFWTLESIELINIFTYGGVEMMSYPMSIYADWLRDLFTYIIPAVFLVYYPSLYILDKPGLEGMPHFIPWLSPIAGFSILLVAWNFWKFGLKHYQSAGT